MRRFLHTLSGICIWVLFTVMGGALIFANGFRVEDRLLGFFFVQDGYWIAMSSGLLLVLISLLHLVTLNYRRSPTKYISFESENGEVSISINAVRDFIRKLGDEFSAVIKMDPQVRDEKKMISIDLNVKVQTGARVPELSRMLQDRVRESIREGLGITEVREIKVKVQEIVGAPLPAKSE